jgi:hydroxymethylpyrimidine/phosphomethylpyrimidine kinase
MSPPRVLIVAGSDSGGGAGIQADIKTVTMLGGFAATAITALTAQNTLGVTGVMPVPADFVVEQMQAVICDIGADAVKIGMIGSADTAERVADILFSSFPRKRESAGPEPAPRLRGDDARLPVVFDPVMVATSGSVLADAATVAAFGRLARIATLVTPNAPELAALTGMGIETEGQLEAAALDYARRTGTAVLAKGGHLPGDTLTDLLAEVDGKVTRWSSARIDTLSTHGTGCTLASAIATGLGAGLALADSVARARDFVRAAMMAAPGFGAGHGPMGHQAVRSPD